MMYKLGQIINCKEADFIVTGIRVHEGIARYVFTAIPDGMKAEDLGRKFQPACCSEEILLSTREDLTKWPA